MGRCQAARWGWFIIAAGNGDAGTEPRKRRYCRRNVRDRQEEERALIVRAKIGDDAAFSELVVRYQQDAFRAALLVLRDAAEAEDVAQEAFLRAYRSMNRFREERPFRPWIVKIAVNQAITAAKQTQRRRERQAETPAPPPGYGIDEMLIDRERASELMAALHQIREKERVVLYLRFFMDFSEKELAEYLGCRPGTVKSRVHRALAKLRDVVEADFPRLVEELG